ncbi:efflux RND transporter permease subunit [Luteithermobacter gelatinilyticus]|uniref:efflux RND transporter permease subunit n=1 Tax=Luteithermobacter gelatinilyticus TaxID=2582913 RepID=UPI0011057DDD|nr:CusA/CzcA family heavy metal efflux RND transporter [Luteithermobacter gelatinilyticus]
MLKQLIKFSLTQRLMILLVSLLIVGGGWVAFQATPIDAFPDVSTTQVKIILKAPGMTPEEVEARITAPVEVEMLGLPKQSILRSITKYALTDITIDFEEGTDIYWARQQVAERLNAIMEDLPDGVSGGIAPMTTPLGEMFMFSIEGDSLSLMEKRSLLDWVIRPALRTVPGVADVNALGGHVRSFEVIPDNQALLARQIPLGELIDALKQNNRNDGAGRLDEGEEVLLVRTGGSINTLEDVANIVVRPHATEPVRVRDIARVQLGAITRYGGVTANGKGETVEGLVLGLRGANAREVVDGARARLAALEPSLPDGVSINIFYDRGKLIDKAIASVSKALAEAIVLVLLLLVVFLGDLRAALTVALILPLAALSTFILMHRFDMSANLMSLGGLAIAIGMLVDAAVVVVENIVTHLGQHKNSRQPRLHMIYRAVSEVSLPVASGILIIIIVFLPLLSLQGLEGKLFVPVALTIVFALSASLVLSLTVIPVIASFLSFNSGHKETWLVRNLQKYYRPILAWSLDHSRIVGMASVVLLVLAGVTYSQVGKTFMPTMDEGDIILQAEKLPSISLNQSLEIDLMTQKKLMTEIPEIIGYVSRAGSDELGLDPMGLNETDGFLVLKPRSEWTVDSKEDLIEKIQAVIADIPGVAFNFTQPIDMRVSEMLTGVRGDIAIKIFGEDQDKLNRLGEEIVSLLSGIDGAGNIYKPANDGAQYLRLSVDRLAAGRLGLNVDDLTTALRAQIEGITVGTVYEGARRTPLLVRGAEQLRNNPARFQNLTLTLPDGRNVPLSSVARIDRVEGPVSIKREKGSRMVVVIGNVKGRDLVGFVDEAKQIVAENLTLPSGYYLEWGGQFENQQRASKRLALVVPVAIGLIFLLLFSTFGSVRQALLVLSNIPFAMTGGIIALWLSGEYLSVPASVGFIALLGIAVLNGVVMVTYFNQLKAMGKPVMQVIFDGASRRLRPVMMTASIAAFGLVPLLLATGPGSEIQRPLAVVVIGGLFTSTLLTLILLPILYRRFGFTEN